jgi:hypothetical protein
MCLEQSVELELARQTEILGENLSHSYFVRQKSRMALSGSGARTPQWKAGQYSALLGSNWHCPHQQTDIPVKYDGTSYLWNHKFFVFLFPEKHNELDINPI